MTTGKFLSFLLIITALLRATNGLPVPSNNQFYYASQGNINRDLKIGDLNFIHTTDTHGWLGSHPNEINYNADWGDFISFTANLKQTITANKTRDFLLIDTGDKYDGNGLSDASLPHGKYSTAIFNKQDYDLLTLGNHELYTENNTIMEYYETAKNSKFKGKYISSNVEFVDNNLDGKLVPFGDKYAYFQTENLKKRILAFSFIFDFQRINSRAKVTPIKEEITKEWFQQVIQRYDETQVDLIIVFGHLPITDVENREINYLHSFLRSVYPNIVIQYFGGHSHIRDFVQFDAKSTGLQSGRFCETVGFLSITNNSKDDSFPQFHRRYIDFNLRSFNYHLSNLGGLNIENSNGAEVSEEISKIRKKLNLDEVYGYIPQNYYMYYEPLTSKKNIYNLLINKILPTLEVKHPTIPRYIMINTGAIRYDLYKGVFTKDTQYIVSPFGNEWNYIKLPSKLASKISDKINKGPVVLNIPEAHIFDISDDGKCPFRHKKGLVKGYTTYDSYGCKGDDTIHNSLGYYEVPNVIQYTDDTTNDDTLVDFIFYSFLKPNILSAINNINKDMKVTSHFFTDDDCFYYGGLSTQDLLRRYFEQFL
ncbi:related to 5^ nucleotidase [Saccharomycodes ludwigii]|uniref:Related to 5^ nucleotidase n=1 Tax=Saccharomycodes ludwigii TaxID=36035 RepID=A0A376B7S8_9ASCO|nr:hypothetical protein SCDLUD_004394 [Saccharomycodes ludwigii]KAH3900074.1 hypothetical protein SCDLUD_004394 [Saccharomycodes ludwigii]SSD60733.1 related to 5^ nucleotidase [Saccharomycodes ludwigii]